METPRRSTTDSVPLGLESVLANSLPTTLLTDRAPERYTVEAVFTRRPEAEEATQITGDETRNFFGEHGYPATTLTISDRRLRISNTNLEELRDGLAVLVAERLAAITADIQNRRDAAATQYREAADHEQQRAAAVAIFASSVRFAARGSAVDPDRTADWDDDGGAAPRLLQQATTAG